MQNYPNFFYCKVLGPCVNFNFFLSINKNSLVSFPHLVTCTICYYVFQTMMSRAMLLVHSYSSNKKLSRQPKDFKFKKDEELSLSGLDITIDDVLMNNVHRHN